jgi:hypothetical protein
LGEEWHCRPVLRLLGVQINDVDCSGTSAGALYGLNLSLKQHESTGNHVFREELCTTYKCGSVCKCLFSFLQ